jgi:hypothetical protein
MGVDYVNPCNLKDQGRRGIAVVNVGVVVTQRDGGRSMFWLPGRAFAVDRDGNMRPLFPNPRRVFH